MTHIYGEMHRYFEFHKQDYYALIKVSESDSLKAYHKALELYVQYVGGDSVEEVKEEGIPRELDEDQALLRFLKAGLNQDEKVGVLMIEFERTKDAPLLIDSNLL